MGTGRARRRRNRSRVEDHISGLPDHHLHSILLRLPTLAAAVRTSVLSRRWHRVWAHLPALSFSKRDQAPLLSIYDAIDAALAAYAAPTLGRLEISIVYESPWFNVADRFVPWLRFVSERLAGELKLVFVFTSSWTSLPGGKPLQEVELPVCERATAIDLCLPHLALLLPPPAAGSFAALRVLRISCDHIGTTELEHVVATQCPLLLDLDLDLELSATVEPHDLAIRSDSLERLKLGGRVRGQITVHAPKLVRFHISMRGARRFQGAQIAARNLAEVIWHGTFHPQCDKIVEAGRHLRRLEVLYFCCRGWKMPRAKMAALLQRFDTVDELDLRFGIYEEKCDYEAFRMDTASLPQCKFLKIDFGSYGLDAFEMIVLPVLRKCANAKKLDIHWSITSKESISNKKKYGYSSCGQLTTDLITLDSLEEIELSFSRVGDGVVVDLVKLLLLGCGAALRRFAIREPRGAPTLSTATREAIAGFCPPEIKVEFYEI